MGRLADARELAIKKKKEELSQLKAASGGAGRISDEAKMGIKEAFNGQSPTSKPTQYDVAYRTGGFEAVRQGIESGTIKSGAPASSISTGTIKSGKTTSTTSQSQSDYISTLQENLIKAQKELTGLKKHDTTVSSQLSQGAGKYGNIKGIDKVGEGGQVSRKGIDMIVEPTQELQRPEYKLDIDELTRQTEESLKAEQEAKKKRLEEKIGIEKSKMEDSIVMEKERTQGQKQAALARYFGDTGGREGMVAEGNLGIIAGIENTGIQSIKKLERDLAEFNLSGEELLANLDAQQQKEIFDAVDTKVEAYEKEYNAKIKQYNEGIKQQADLRKEQADLRKEEFEYQKYIDTQTRAERDFQYKVFQDEQSALRNFDKDLQGKMKFLFENYGSMSDGMIYEMGKDVGLDADSVLKITQARTIEEKKAKTEELMNLVNLPPTQRKIMLDMMDYENVEMVNSTLDSIYQEVRQQKLKEVREEAFARKTTSSGGGGSKTLKTPKSVFTEPELAKINMVRLSQGRGDEPLPLNFQDLTAEEQAVLIDSEVLKEYIDGVRSGVYTAPSAEDSLKLVEGFVKTNNFFPGLENVGIGKNIYSNNPQIENISTPNKVTGDLQSNLQQELDALKDL